MKLGYWVPSRLAAVAMMTAGTAYAAPEYASIEVNEGIFVTPAFSIENRYDDNIFQTDNNEKDSLITVLTPGVSIDAKKDRASLNISYASEIGWIHSSNADNYQDHLGRVLFGLEGSRSFLRLDAFHEREHDDRGTGPSNGFGAQTTTVFDEPTEYQKGGYGGRIGVTLVDRWRVEIGGGADNTNYLNFRSVTRDRDRETDSRSGGIYFALSPRTELLFEASRKSIDYDNTPIINNAPGVSLDSKETRFIGGVTWQATAKTTGTLKIGVVEKDFEDGRRKDRDNASWDALITYEPRTYMKFSFDAFRGPRETDGQGDSIDVSRYGVRWEHAWSGRLSTDVGVAIVEEDYQGSARNDDFTRFNVSANYDWDRWLTFSAGYRFSTRDSNQTNADFDRNVVYFTAAAGL